MAGTSTPFFLYPTGSPPVVVNGGVRSLFAFWMGGASSATTAPSDQTSTVGSRWVTGANRKKLIELYDAVRAERELRERLKKKKKIAASVKEAVREAATAIEAVEQSPQTEQVAVLLSDLSRSLDAIKLNVARAVAAEQAAQAIAAAHRLMQEAAIARAAQEDEEEAITLLLMH